MDCVSHNPSSGVINNNYNRGSRVTKMSLFKKRAYYKPFDYEWAFQSYDMQQKMHWLPSEVPLHEDVRDWNERLSAEEKNLISQILKFFTQGDVDIAQAYLDKYIPKFKAPEVRMMLSSFATSEANHAHSYSLLNDTIGLPDKEYKAFQEYKEMSDTMFEKQLELDTQIRMLEEQRRKEMKEIRTKVQKEKSEKVKQEKLELEKKRLEMIEKKRINRELRENLIQQSPPTLRRSARIHNRFNDDSEYKYRRGSIYKKE